MQQPLSKKSRYLLAWVLNPTSNAAIFPKVLRLENAKSPDEVTVPKNTLFFTFAKAEVETAEEFQSAFLGLSVGIGSSISCSIPYEIENNGKHYFIGTREKLDGVECVYNSDAKMYLPLFCLDTINYEIIDL